MSNLSNLVKELEAIISTSEKAKVKLSSLETTTSVLKLGSFEKTIAEISEMSLALRGLKEALSGLSRVPTAEFKALSDSLHGIGQAASVSTTAKSLGEIVYQARAMSTNMGELTEKLRAFQQAANSSASATKMLQGLSQIKNSIAERTQDITMGVTHQAGTPLRDRLKAENAALDSQLDAERKFIAARKTAHEAALAEQKAYNEKEIALEIEAANNKRAAAARVSVTSGIGAYGKTKEEQRRLEAESDARQNAIISQQLYQDEAIAEDKLRAAKKIEDANARLAAAQSANLPELKPGYVRIVHKGAANFAGSIRSQGLNYSGQGMVSSTARVFGDINDVRYESGDPRFQNNPAYVFDVPAAEARLHDDPTRSPGVIPAKYYVGTVQPETFSSEEARQRYLEERQQVIDARKQRAAERAARKEAARARIAAGDTKEVRTLAQDMAEANNEQARRERAEARAAAAREESRLRAEQVRASLSSDRSPGLRRRFLTRVENELATSGMIAETFPSMSPRQRAALLYQRELEASMRGRAGGSGLNVSLPNLPTIDTTKPAGKAQDIFRTLVSGGSQNLQEVTSNIKAAMEQYGLMGASLEDIRKHSFNAATGIHTFDVQTKDGTKAVIEMNSQGQTLAQGSQAMFTGLMGGAQKATEYLKRMGFELKDLKSISKDPTSGTQLFKFENVDKQTGAVQRATVAIDKHGRILNDTSTRFRSLESMIQRNILKVFEWSLAVGVVYGAFNKLGESLTMLKELDDMFAGIGASANISKENAVSFFDAAQKAARATGTSLESVMKIYHDAVRVTNPLGNTSTRANVTAKFAEDIMKFSRLTGMDPEKSYDLLLGAMNQLTKANAPLTETLGRTTAFMDSLAYVAQRTGVPLADLGETFAITGEAAETAGMTMQDVAATAGEIARNSTKSASEIGNSVRRMITTIDSESGAKALGKFGVSTTDAAGRTRSFMEVIGELSKLYKSGVLDEGAQREINYALGGGPRGSQDVALVIRGFENIAGVAADAGKEQNIAGASAKMLAEYNKTLGSSLTNLNTAFFNLVATLGTEGGLTSSLKGVVDLMSGLLDGLSGITAATGTSTTRIIALAAAMAVLTKYKPQIGGALSSLGSMIFRRTPQAGSELITTEEGGIREITTRTTPRRTFRQGVSDNMVGFGGKMGMAGAFALMASSGEDSLAKGGLHAGAIMGGAVISTVLTGSPFIGAAIGDAIGTTVTRRLSENELLAKDPTMLSADELQQQYNLALERLKSSTQAGFGPLGTVRELGIGIRDILGMNAPVGDAATFNLQRYKTMGGGIEAATAISEQLAAGMPGYTINPEELMRQFDALLAIEKQLAVKNILNTTQTLSRNLYEEQSIERFRQAKSTASAAGESAFGDDRRRARAAVQTGDMSVAEYNKLKDGWTAWKDQGYIVMEEMAGMAGMTADQVAQKYAAMPEEIRSDVISALNSVNQMQQQLAEKTAIDPEAMKRDVAETLADVKAMFLAQGDIFKTTWKFPGMLDLGKLNPSQIADMFKLAKNLQNQYLKITPVIDMETFMKDVEKMPTLANGEFKDNPLQMETRPEFQQMALGMINERIANEGQFNIQRLRDRNPSEFPMIQQMVRRWEGFLKNIPGYSAQAKTEKFNLVMGEDPVWKNLITTQEALTYALEELNATEKKQLEGMWNIPDGATVMVPLNSLYYAPKAPMGGPGDFTGNPEESLFGPVGGILDPLALSSDQASTSVNSLATAANSAAGILANLGTIQYNVSNQGGIGWMDAGAGLPGGHIAQGGGMGSFLPGMGGGGWGAQTRATLLEDPLNALEPLLSWPGELWNNFTFGMNQMAPARPMSAPQSNPSIQASQRNAPINLTTNVAVELDGAVIARAVSRQQSNSLRGASRGSGYASGGLL